MKVSYVEDLANHNGPKSCGAAPEGGIEALTGGRTGWVLSRGTTRKERGTLMCSVGDKPTAVKVRNLAAGIAGKRETESLAIDKAIFRNGEQVIGP
jgi:hypothetical protein